MKETIKKQIEIANKLKESGDSSVIKLADDLISSCNEQIKILSMRLPTIEEFKELLSHFSKFDEINNELVILNEDDNKILTLPAAGRADLSNAAAGYYWSSSALTGADSDMAYYIYFDKSCGHGIYCSSGGRYSVRLVSDEPFEGGIKFGNIYWKPENEEGYFAFNEIIKKFKQPKWNLLN